MEIVFLIIGLILGHHENKISKEFILLKNKLTKKEKVHPSVITRGREYVEPERLDSNSAVIEPKTPQQIDFEEEEQIRKMNPGS